jgi:hypothetical protein
MRSGTLLRVAHPFDKALFVGDPGQLDPFSTVETHRWLGLSWDPMSSAVAVLLTNNPDIAVHTLPVSWRLPASAAPVVSEAFYPFTGFTSATSGSDRGMRWNTRPFGATAIDCALPTAVVTRAGIPELLDAHPSVERVHLGVPVKFPDGWRRTSRSSRTCPGTASRPVRLRSGVSPGPA